MAKKTKASAPVAAPTVQAAAPVPAAAVPLVTVETVPANSVPSAPAAPVAKKSKKARATPAPVKSTVDRSAFKFAVWVGNSARPKLWLKFMNELGPALGGISPRKLQNIHIAELKRVNLKITPTLED